MLKSGKKYSELLNLGFEFVETESEAEPEEEDEGVYRIVSR